MEDEKEYELERRQNVKKETRMGGIVREGRS